MPRGKRLDLVGERFGLLTVQAKVASEHGKSSRWACLCDCGRSSVVNGKDLVAEKTKSCGCGGSKPGGIGHGASRKDHPNRPEFVAWLNMVGRCTYRGTSYWKNYGGRGIKVCDRWASSFSNFLEDVGPRPSPVHSLDRKNNDGNYEPGNVRWATKKEQGRNRRGLRMVEHQGETLSVAEWAERFGMKERTLRGRLDRGWSMSRALSPARARVQ